MKKIIALFLCLLFCFGSLAFAEDSWTCPNCGLECTWNFCPDCGTKKPTDWTCPNCGVECTSNFCPNCGNRNPSMPVYNVGDTVTMGTWGSEAIEWQVMEVKADGTCVLMSVKGLDAKPYNTEMTDVIWATCSLRTWLNGEFYEKAFSDGEKSKIKITTVENLDNKKRGTKGGSTTKDKVYILSLEEIGKYYNIDPYSENSEDCRAEALICMPTDTAVKNRAYVTSQKAVDMVQPDYNYPLKAGACWWWLRSPGLYQSLAAFVSTEGNVYDIGYGVVVADRCIRPVISVQL